MVVLGVEVAMLDIQQLEESWQQQMGAELEQSYMQSLQRFLQQEQALERTIYPPQADIFNAFNSTAFDQVKVVILGQDPYHGPGQAHGLCFSVMPDVRIPPSLLNIFKEIERDLGITIPDHGCLQSWAEQGVLLLNATLTVEGGKAGSHQKQGWEEFTDAAIEQLNAHRESLVFMLWGSYAQKKGQLIDDDRHCVLTSPHPSPLSAHRGFLGNNHFSQANSYLESRGEVPVDWSLPRLESVSSSMVQSTLF
jgi:uracil-DNA glycosylase